MLATTSQSFGEPTWTLVFLSAKTAGNGDMQHFHVESKVPNASNTTVLTNLITIENSVGVARQMPRSTRQDWKPRRVNHAPTHSNVLTAGATTKPTPTSVYFGDTNSMGNSTRKSTPRSMKTDQNQFILKWTALLPNDYQKPQKPLSKRLQELSHRQYNPQNTSLFWHHPNPRTTLVWNLKDSEYFKLWRGTSYGHLPSSQLDLFCKNSFRQQRFPEGHYLYQHSSFFSSFSFTQRHP